MCSTWLSALTALAVLVEARAGGHAVLGWQAFRLYRGLSAASGTSEREVATEAFRWPLGDEPVVLAGWAIVVAGWFRDPSEVGPTASSFRTLAAQPGGLGRWLLGVTAAGFVAFGFYEIFHARYLHIRRVG